MAKNEAALNVRALSNDELGRLQEQLAEEMRFRVELLSESPATLRRALADGPAQWLLDMVEDAKATHRWLSQRGTLALLAPWEEQLLGVLLHEAVREQRQADVG